MRWFQHGAVYRGFLAQPRPSGGRGGDEQPGLCRERGERGHGTTGVPSLQEQATVLSCIRTFHSPVPPVTEQDQSCNTAMDCFNSTDPVAVNSTLLYDYNNDEDNLWFRNDTAGPLESCFPPRPRQFQCSVCLHDGTVYAICKKLTDKVRMVMEAVGKSVSISTSDCPTLPTSTADAQQWPQLVIGIIVTLLLIIIIGVCLYRKYCKNRRVQTRNEIQNDPQEVMVMTATTAEASEDNHTPPLLSCRADGINYGSQQQLSIEQVYD